jgi:hypothetical protein
VEWIRGFPSPCGKTSRIGRESNPLPSDYQPSPLPTELFMLAYVVLIWVEVHFDRRDRAGAHACTHARTHALAEWKGVWALTILTFWALAISTFWALKISTFWALDFPVGAHWHKTTNSRGFYTALYVIILSNANTLPGEGGGLGPGTQDFFGPHEMASSR